MPEVDRVATRRKRNLILCLLPWGYCVIMTFRYGYDAPYWDQWWKVPMIEKVFNGSVSIADYWTLINEHRVFFPNLIAIPLARLTHWNLRIELALTLVFATLAFGVVALMFLRAETRRPEAGTLWALPISALLAFSFSQHMVWVWSLHMMITMTALCIVLVVFLIGSGELTLPKFVLAAMTALVGSYSFGAGIAAWPVGLLMLLLCPGLSTRRRGVLSLAWCLCAGATMLGYFFQYQSTPANENAIAVVTRPLSYLLYLLAYIGSPLFSYSAPLSASAGLAGALAAVYLLSKSRRDGLGTGLPFIGLMAIACAVASLSGLKQSHEGMAQALSSRYIIWPAFFWIGLLGLTYARSLAGTETSGPRSGHAAVAAAAAIAIFALLSSIYGTYRADERHDAFLLGRKALVEGRVDDDLRYLYPDTDVPSRMRQTLVRHHLSVFKKDR